MAIEKRTLFTLISGVVLCVVALVMTKMYLDQQKLAIQEKAKKAIANAQANQSAVLVSKQDIPQGSVIESDMLGTAIVPTKFVQPQAVSSLDRIAGMVTLAPISEGEQISLSKLTNERKASVGDLAGTTPSGKRAISIMVDNIASLSGMVKPGDYVDVLATIQIPVQGADGQVTRQMVVVPLFQNVLVLAVGQNTRVVSRSGSRYAQAPAASGGGGLITLALGPQEANLIAFVQEQGKVRLTMRSPADAKIEPMASASWDSLFQYIMPPKQDVKPVVDTTEYVEVFRGLNKERVPLSK
ncbi:MAG: Flp pilus assembly protein CpaB [Candidatus Omnitrophica bacterium CG23_combo_of_CG06-09_8_20_14_all_40_11]|nr:MAG: Flp pilus assembly protein CpaB [Candidatus Omnitrophica bacterium CG23_combo_of_CG06-09_8_20_14_all_40_11]